MIVPRVQTPVPLEGLADELDEAHQELHGFGLDAAAYRLAIAQLELEHGTANGALRGVFCFNLGNHDATAQDRADPSVTLFDTVPEHEGSAASSTKAVHLRRAYPDLHAGLVGYWMALLASFATAYDALRTGDPAAFAHALKVDRYYTADEAAYAKALASLMRAEPAPVSA